MVGQTRAYPPIDQRLERFRRTVTNEDELRRAIRTLAGVNAAVSVNRLTPGGLIVIACPIAVSSPIVIPDTCPGLTITAAARVPITPRGVLATLFDVRAELVTLRDLFVYATTGPTGLYTSYCTAFVTASAALAAGRSVTRLSVLDCDAFVDQIYVDASGGKATEAMIARNRQVEANAAHVTSLIIDSLDCHVVDNNLPDGAPTAGAIAVTANGGRCSIRGNNVNGGAITTSASLGNNRLGGNVNVGTKAYAATDIDADVNQAIACKIASLRA